MTEQEALQEFWDNALHPSLKPEISEEAKAVAMKALEKQIPKKPCLEDQFIDKSEEWHKQYGISWKVYRCPACDWSTGISTITREPYRPNHCKNCGQALDWEGY